MYPPKFGNLWLKILHPYARGCRHLILTFDIPHRAIWIYILENLIAWELVDFVYDLCQSRIHNSFLLHLARLTLVIKFNHRTLNMEVPIEVLSNQNYCFPWRSIHFLDGNALYPII